MRLESAATIKRVSGADEAAVNCAERGQAYGRGAIHLAAVAWTAGKGIDSFRASGDFKRSATTRIVYSVAPRLRSHTASARLPISLRRESSRKSLSKVDASCAGALASSTSGSCTRASSASNACATAAKL